MKMKMRFIKYPLVAVFLLALVLIQTSATVMFAPTAAAKTVAQMNIDEKARSWWYYNALRICLASTNWNWARVDIESGNWIDNDVPITNVNGAFMRDIVSDIGGWSDVSGDFQASCASNSGQIFKQAFALWGVDPLDLICGSATDTNDDVLRRGGLGDCYASNNDFDERIANSVNRGPAWDTRVNTILGHIDDAVYGGNSPGSQLTVPALQYHYYLNSFKKACAYNATGITDREPNGSNVYQVSEYIGGSMTTVYYVGDRPPSAAPPTWPDSTTVTCANLAAGARNQAWIDAYVSAIVADPTQAPTNAEGEDNEGTSCAISGIGWIVCPVATFLSWVTDMAYAGVEQLMIVQPVSLTGSGSSAAIYQIWASIRDLANIAFIFAFFMIILSHATSIGLSSYGMKKMLPRLIVAAVLVNLSYYICALAVDLSNVFGAGIDGIITGAYNSADAEATGANSWTTVVGSALALTGIFAGGATFLGAVGGAAAAAGGGGGAMLGAAWAMLLPFLITALLAVVTALVVLVLRQALIILLIVISPLAFVAYILPNTESLFSKWRKAFMAMMVFYPLVALVFAGSKVAAQILRTAAPGDSGLHELLRIASLGIQFFPLIALPFIMKFSGGVLSRIAGIVNNPNKGPFDAMRKRAEGYKDTKLKQSRSRANEYLDKQRDGMQFKQNWRGKTVPVGKRNRMMHALSRPYTSQIERDAIRKSTEDRYQESTAKMVNSNLALRDDGSGSPINPDFARKMAGESVRDRKRFEALSEANRNSASAIAAAQAATQRATTDSNAASSEYTDARAAAQTDRQSDHNTILASLVAAQGKTYSRTMKAAEEARKRASVAQAQGRAIDPADIAAINAADNLQTSLNQEADRQVNANGIDYEARHNVQAKMYDAAYAENAMRDAEVNLQSAQQPVIKATAEVGEVTLDKINRVIARGEAVIDEIDTKDLKSASILQSNLRLSGQNYKDIMDQPIGTTITSPEGKSLIVTQAMKTAAGSTMIGQTRELNTVLEMAGQMEEQSWRSFLVGQTKSNFSSVKAKQVALIDEQLQNDLIAGRLNTPQAFQTAYRQATARRVSTLNNNTYASQEAASMKTIHELLSSNQLDPQTAATLKEFSRNALRSPSVSQNIPATALEYHRQIAALP